MKKILLSIACIAAVQMIHAQQKEGTVFYERTINNWKLANNDQVRNFAPEFNTSKYVLYFNDSISIYKLSPYENAPEPFAGGEGGGGFRRVFSIGAGGGDLFKNFATGLSTQAIELGGKNFLITDTIKKQPWKISAETKEILGVLCRKATTKTTQPSFQSRTFYFNRNKPADDTATKQAPPAPREIEIVAWFAQTILAPVGPDTYGQLPGVILELDVDNGTTVYKALTLKTTVEAKELKEPKKGKKVTRQEYNQLLQALMKNQSGGFGGGQIMMRIGN
ncbi:MAG: GLPGLI family protein [Flavobacterium sp.]|nr:GLPGLI family protein [Flavobacterium sp.]